VKTPVVLWFTGLSGSGKTTIAHAVAADMRARGHTTLLLDGDELRRGLSRDLGFSPADRKENIRRIAEVASLAYRQGLVVLVSVISPYQTDRGLARLLVPRDDFFEIFVDCPLEVCQERDTKGFYKKALQGEIQNFTGISAPYETPTAPELTLHTHQDSVEICTVLVLKLLEKQENKI
jgi:adenylyl-sulfate kinase